MPTGLLGTSPRVQSYKFADLRGYDKMTVSVFNKTDQIVTCTVEGSFTDGFDDVMTLKGQNPFTVAAGANDYQVLSNLMPFVRLKTQYATAPTTGTLSAIIFKEKT